MHNMERQSKRAFTFFVVFTFFLIVSSATDDQPQSKESNDHSSVDESVASVSKVDSDVSGDSKEPKTGNDSNAKKPDAASESVDKNCTAAGKNDTACKVDDRSFVTRLFDNMSENREMLIRMMYVLLGVTGIVIVFFVIRAIGLRRRRNKSRKYGVITTRGDLEMEPLGQGEDEDEDYTVFEMNGRTK